MSKTRLDRAVERAASALVKALTASGADAAPLLATANETTMKAIAAADENVIVDGEVFIRGEVAYAIMKRVVETGSQMIAVAIFPRLPPENRNEIVGEILDAFTATANELTDMLVARCARVQ